MAGAVTPIETQRLTQGPCAANRRGLYNPTSAASPPMALVLLRVQRLARFATFPAAAVDSTLDGPARGWHNQGHGT
jgi:hypothetical protein